MNKPENKNKLPKNALPPIEPEEDDNSFQFFKHSTGPILEALKKATIRIRPATTERLEAYKLPEDAETASDHSEDAGPGLSPLDLPEDIFTGKKTLGAQAVKEQLPDDIFANKKISETTLRSGSLPDINFLKICKAFANKHDRFAGPLISVLAHIIILSFIGGIIVFRAPVEQREISIELTEVELREINEEPSPIIEEKEKELRENIETEIPEMTFQSLDMAENSFSEDVSGKDGSENFTDMSSMANLDLVNINTSAAALKMPELFSARAPAKRKKAIEKYGGGDNTEKAVIRALKWLSTQQNADGSWGKVAEHKPAMTGLAVLAFLSHGESPQSKEYGQTVLTGIKKLVEFSGEKGIENCDNGFGHAILTYALAEAAAFTSMPEVIEATQKRTASIIKAMNKFGSFNIAYDNTPQKSDKDPKTGKLKKGIIAGEPRCDLSFAGWNYQALRAAYITGFPIDGIDNAILKSIEGIINIHQAEGGGFSHGINGGKYPADGTVTPVGTLCLQLLGAGKSPAVQNGLRWMEKHDKGAMLQCKWQKEQRFPLYLWYYQTQALFQGHQGTGKVWKDWNKDLTETLLKNQEKDGRWFSPAARISETEDGENVKLFSESNDLAIYCTSLCTLMLEVYYRYLPSYEVVRNSPGISGEDKMSGLVVYTSRLPKAQGEKDAGQSVSVMKPIQIGKINGRPSAPDDELVEDEFAVYSVEGTTVHVKEAKDFPQVLTANQRIAVFLDDMMPENFRGNILLKAAVGNGLEKENKTDSSSLEILINNKEIWKHSIKSRNSLVTALIPSSYLQNGGNILEIRNTGTLPICFDGFRAETYKIGNTPVFMAIEDLDRMPADCRSGFGMGLINLKFADNNKKKIVNKNEDDGYGKDAIGSNKNASEEELITGGDLVTMSGNERWSIEKRRARIARLRNNFDAVANSSPEAKETYKYLLERIERHLKIGIEPIVRIEGNPDVKMVEDIATASSGFVYYWVLAQKNEDDAKKLYETLNAKTQVAEISLENFAYAKSAACKIWRYDEHKEAMPYVKKMLDKADTSKKTDNKNPSELWGLLSCRDSEQKGLFFQKKYLNRLPLQATEWLWSGGSSLILTDVIDGNRFFDIVNKDPKLSFYGLKRLSSFFGKGLKLHCNVLPTLREDTLDDVYWTAAMNTEDTAVIQISSRWNENKELEIICPLTWSGKTKMEIVTGYVPENYPDKSIERVKTSSSTINIPTTGLEKEYGEGLFKQKMCVSDCVTIKLTRSGVREMEKPRDMLSWEKTKEQKFETKALDVSFRHPDAKLIRTAIRAPNGIIGEDSLNYKGQLVDASRGEIDGAENVLPWEAKSTLVEISYPKEKAEGPEGARIYFGSGPTNVKEFSFWVYPKLDKTARKVVTPLRFYYDDNFFSTELRVNKWQRVTVPCVKVKPPYWKNICVIGEPKLAEYTKGRTVSFEFNGFAVYGEEHMKKGLSGLESARAIPGRNSISFLLLGKPGMYGEYRYLLKEPLDVIPDEALKENKITFNYNKDARIVEISLNFSKQTDPAETKFSALTHDEKKLIKDNGCIPVLVKAALVKPAEPVKDKAPHDDKHKNLSSHTKMESRK